jgi:hypothetical protein
MREFSRLVLTNVPFSVLVAVYEVASVKHKTLFVKAIVPVPLLCSVKNLFLRLSLLQACAKRSNTKSSLSVMRFCQARTV